MIQLECIEFWFFLLSKQWKAIYIDSIQRFHLFGSLLRPIKENLSELFKMTKLSELIRYNVKSWKFLIISKSKKKEVKNINLTTCSCKEHTYLSNKKVG